MLQTVVHFLAHPNFRIRNGIYTWFAKVIIVIEAITVIVMI